ncbi:MAG: glycosyltransferase family 2 protein, partial [Paludibacter sp.]
MNPKVSILVPVYNVSKYIERCARSLFEQTFQDIEYIFVDDASSDNSIDLLNNVLLDYPIRQKQVSILNNKKNQGVGISRNIAIDFSKGEYIAFIDSDDYIESNTIEVLYNFSVLENADIVVFDMEIECNHHKEIISDKILVHKEENLKNILTEEISHNLCNKFVRSRLYKMNECRIPNGLNYHEDFYVCVRLFFYAEIIKKIDKVFYHYVYTNSVSITKRMSKM